MSHLPESGKQSRILLEWNHLISGLLGEDWLMRKSHSGKSTQILSLTTGSEFQFGDPQRLNRTENIKNMDTPVFKTAMTSSETQVHNNSMMAIRVMGLGQFCPIMQRTKY